MYSWYHKKYKLNAEDVIYIGDMPSDIDSAKQANCKIISVLYADKKMNNKS